MRRITAACLFLPLLISFTLPVPAQTRPRRVRQTVVALAEATTPTSAPERPRVLHKGTSRARPDVWREEPRVGERSRRWPWLLLGAGVSIGLGSIGRGRRSCTPSRAVLIEQPGVAW